MNLQTIKTAARRIFGISCPVCNSNLVKPDGVKLYARIGGMFMVESYCPKKDYIKMTAMTLGAPQLTLTGDDAAQEIELRVGAEDAELMECSYCKTTNTDGRQIYVCDICETDVCSDCSVNCENDVLCKNCHP